MSSSSNVTRLVAGATADAAGGIRLQFSTETNIRLSQISLEYWESFDERFDASINFRQQGYLFLLTSESGDRSLSSEPRIAAVARRTSDAG